jgi:hypothetical protein
LNTAAGRLIDGGSTVAGLARGFGPGVTVKFRHISHRRGRRYVEVMGRYAWIALMLCACAGTDPVLRNAPKPNPAAVAGVAAATAAAITLASPQAAAAAQEGKGKPDPSDRGIEVRQTVPADVFDRLDHKAGDHQPDGAGATHVGDAGTDAPAAQ